MAYLLFLLLPPLYSAFGIGLIYSNVISSSLSPFPQMAGTAAALSGTIQMAVQEQYSGRYQRVTRRQRFGARDFILLCSAIVLLMVFSIMRTSVQ